MAMDINVSDLRGFNFKNFAKRFNKLKKPKFEVTDSTKVKKTVVAGEQQTKTFTIKNKGDLTIPAGSRLVQIRGPEDTTVDMTPLDCVPAGESATFSITFNAAAAEGFTKHVWKMAGPNGRRFGPRMGCNYTVLDLSEVPENFRENLEALVSMGFTFEEAREKIQEANGDIGLAVSMMSRNA